MAAVNVFVYPNGPDEDSFAERVSGAIETALDAIVSSSDTVESGHVEVRYEHPGEDVSGRDCDGVSDTSVDQFHREFDQYTACHHRDEVGCHLGVSTNNIGGIADDGSNFGSGEGAFVDRRIAVTGGDTKYYENLAIQELLHTVLDYRIVAPWDVHPGDHGHEHDLGTRTDEGLEQPMATGYYGENGNHGEEGTCANQNVDLEGYTNEPSRCTIRALDATYKSDFNSDPSTSPGERWGETRTIRIGSSWQEIQLGDTYEYPIVLSKPLSFEGSQPAHVRFRSVDHNAATVEGRIEEWGYQNGFHYEEEAGLLAVNGGAIQNDQRTGHVEAGAWPGVYDAWQRVVFDHPSGFREDPIVITQPQTYYGGHPIVTRVRDVTASGFEVCLQEEEIRYESNDGHVEERVGWFATTPTTATVDGMAYEAGRRELDEDWTTVEFQETYDTPVFLADLQTFRGPNPCTLRYRNLTGTSVDLVVQEGTSKDEETSHVDEQVGYVVAEPAVFGT